MTFDEGRFLAKRYGRLASVGLLAMRELRAAHAVSIGMDETETRDASIFSEMVESHFEEAAVWAAWTAAHYGAAALRAADCPRDLAWGGER
jgi:hypothetical protein